MYGRGGAGGGSRDRSILLTSGWNVATLDVSTASYHYIEAVAYNTAWDHDYRALAWLLAPGPEIHTELLESDGGYTWSSLGTVFDNGDTYCFPRSLIWDGDISKWIMQYAGPHGGGDEEVGLATSPDLINWTDLGYVVTPDTAPAPADTVRLFGGGIIKVGVTYYMIVEEQYTPLTDCDYDFGLYSSSDLATWARVGTILQKGAAGQWDQGGIFQSEIVYSAGDGKYVLCYGGAETADDQDERFIGLAYADAITGPYTRFDGNPIISTPNIMYGEPFVFWDPLHLRWRIYIRKWNPVTSQWYSYVANR